MQVIIGNPNPIEVVRQEDGSLTVRSLFRESETTLRYPEGMDVYSAALATIDALGSHMARDAVPAWIESDEPVLKRLLCEHYGTKQHATRPGDWGRYTGGAPE